jgi:hypothetical protein
MKTNTPKSAVIDTPARRALVDAITERDKLGEQLARKRGEVDKIISETKELGVAEAKAALDAFLAREKKRVQDWIAAGGVGLRPGLDAAAHTKLTHKHDDLKVTESAYVSVREGAEAAVRELDAEYRAAEQRERTARAGVMAEIAAAELAAFREIATAALESALRVYALRSSLIAHCRDSAAAGDTSGNFIFAVNEAQRSGWGATAFAGLLAHVDTSPSLDIRREAARLQTAWNGFSDLLSINPGADVNHALESERPIAETKAA